MGKLGTGWRIIAEAALLVAAGPAQGACGGATQLLMPIEFDPGSAALEPLAPRVRRFALAYGPAGTDIDSIAVTVMGDLGEGAEYDGASAEARAADKALAEARLAAIRARLDFGKPLTDVNIRATRQIFGAEDVAANPMLNDRVRAGLFLSMMVPRGPAKPGQPVPTC